MIAVVADARPGGVLVHCGGGRDRTGLAVWLLLALVGVDSHDIVDDYLLSAERLARVWQTLGLGDQNGKIDALLAERNTTVRDAMLTTVTSADVETRLRYAAVIDTQLAKLRRRLLTS